MAAPVQSREARGFALRVALLLALLVGAPWVGRRVLGTVSWRELTAQTRDQLFVLARAGGPLDDPRLEGEHDFDQHWGADYSGGPTRHLAQFTFRPEGCGSARLAVLLTNEPHGPEATIRIDHFGLHLEGLRDIAAQLQRFLTELDVPVVANEERELVRLFSGEEYEVPAGRTLQVVELGLPATGFAASISAEVAVAVDGVDLLSHAFGGHRPESGLRVSLGESLGYSLPAARPVLAGERLSVSENSGLLAYLLGVLGPP